MDEKITPNHNICKAGVILALMHSCALALPLPFVAHN